MNKKRIRVLRTLEYVGTSDWVNSTIKGGLVSNGGKASFANGSYIKELSCEHIENLGGVETDDVPV